MCSVICNCLHSTETFWTQYMGVIYVCLSSTIQVANNFGICPKRNKTVCCGTNLAVADMTSSQVLKLLSKRACLTRHISKSTIEHVLTHTKNMIHTWWYKLNTSRSMSRLWRATRRSGQRKRHGGWRGRVYGIYKNTTQLKQKNSFSDVMCYTTYV